jgi:hypothetical protein
MPDLVQVTAPSGAKFTVAKDAADAFSGFLTDLEKTGYKIDPATSGGYNPRNIAGTDTPSQHSFGHAIDINPGSNARGAKTPSDLPANVADLAAAHGLTWGGGWSGDTRDPMHFELSGKPVAEAAAPSIDDLRGRIDALRAKAAPAASGGDAAAPGEAEAPSVDDLKARISALPRAPAPPAATGPNLGPLLAGPGRYSGTPGTPTAPSEMPPAAPAAAPPPAPTTGATGGVDDYGRPLDPNALLPGALRRVEAAAGAGYKDTPPILGPVGQQWIDKAAPWANPVFSGIDVLRGGANALSSGALQGVYEAGSAIGGPSLGRDLATLAIVAPAAKIAGGEYAPASAATRTAMREGSVLRPGEGWQLPEGSFNVNPLDRSFADYNTRLNLTEEAAPKTAVPDKPPPAAAEPARPKTLLEAATLPEASAADEASADAGPQAAGAQVTPPGAAPGPTIAEKQRNLQADIQETVRERAQKAQQSGGAPGRDDTPYVTNIPGGTLEPRPEAERNLSYQTAIDHKDQMFRSPTEYKEPYDTTTKRRNDGMVDLLKQDAGDDVVTANLRDERKKVAPEAFGAWRGQQEVDAQPLVSQIDELLKSPEGKRDAVKNTFSAVRAKFYDDAGNLENTPSTLYGVKKHIDDLLDKAAKPADREGNDAAAVKRELQFLQGKVNDLIGSGAPNYTAYRQAYREASLPINQQEFLQRYQTGSKKLTGTDGMLQESKLNQMLTDIYNDRNKPGIKLAKSLTDEQIQNIINTRNEVAARQNLDQRMKVPGSATFQMLSRSAETGRGPLGQMFAQLPGMAVHGLAYGTGNPLLYGVGATMNAAAPWIKAATETRRLNVLRKMDAENRTHLLSQPPYPDNPLAP